jgi:hypothetical protein
MATATKAATNWTKFSFRFFIVTSRRRNAVTPSVVTPSAVTQVVTSHRTLASPKRSGSLSEIFEMSCFGFGWKVVEDLWS